MNKKILALGALLVLLVGTVYFNDQISGWFGVSYTADVTGQVDDVESELVAIEAMISDGTFTPEQAVEAKDRLLTKLDAAQTTITQGRTSGLSPQEIVNLTINYERLKKLVADYRVSLTELDKQVAAAPEAMKKRFVNKSSGRSTVAIVEETAAQLGQEVVDAVNELNESDDAVVEELPDEIVDVIEGATEEVLVASSTEAVAEDATTTEATPISDEMATSTEATTSPDATASSTDAS